MNEILVENASSFKETSFEANLFNFLDYWENEFWSEKQEKICYWRLRILTET